MLLRFILLALSLAMVAAVRAAGPDVAFYYGPRLPVEAFASFDIVVVDPDHEQPLHPQGGLDSELFAYLSLGEVHPGRAWASRIPAAWRLGENTAWGSILIDQAAEGWPDFVAERIVGPLWAKGYRGFFLDTLDSWQLAKGADHAAQSAGLVRVIRHLQARYPGIRLIFNRGFEILPEVSDAVFAVAAESLYRGWDARLRRYVEVDAADREWLQGKLREVRDTLGKPVIVIDYVAPDDTALTRETAKRILADGFIPWVTDTDLAAGGIGRIEPIPRRVMVVIDGQEAPAINYTNAHRFLEMPLNQLGYRVEYVDVRQPLPASVSPRIYAGVVSWLTGGIGSAGTAYQKWLQARLREGTRLAILDDLGFAPGPAFLREAGLRRGPEDHGTLRITAQDPMVGFETAPLPVGRELVPLQLTVPGAQTLLRLTDAGGQAYDAAAITPWGGFVLAPFVVLPLPGVDEQARWVIDPFAFLSASLRLPPLPVPDTTTENGRRLFFAHIDGDGFPSFAEFPGSPLSGEVLLREVLERYRVPHAMSVIEVETSAEGKYPQLSGRMEALARRMFALPHVEIANHSYTHPFYWAKVEAGEYADAAQGYRLAPEGYVPSLTREIVGAKDYIEKHLAPPGKPVTLMLWTGNAAPTEAALKIAAEAGMRNMNGGNTTIRKRNPSLTAVSSLGVWRGDGFQVYAPQMNENVYTNLWTGPFYGFQDVIETFEMTDRPRRLKPIDIYYHTYSVTKRAGLNALRKVYDWALAQPVYPVFPSEYVDKAMNFNTLGLARELDSGALVVRNANALRTLRAPRALGEPDVAASEQLAGYLPGGTDNYLHLAADHATLRFAPVAADTPTLRYANARLTAWTRDGRNLSARLDGHVPLEFGLAHIDGCTLRADGAPLRPAHSEDGLKHFRLPDASATLALSCR